jgi:hypothetical protein
MRPIPSLLPTVTVQVDDAERHLILQGPTQEIRLDLQVVADLFRRGPRVRGLRECVRYQVGPLSLALYPNNRFYFPEFHIHWSGLGLVFDLAGTEVVQAFPMLPWDDEPRPDPVQFIDAVEG